MENQTTTEYVFRLFDFLTVTFFFAGIFFSEGLEVAFNAFFLSSVSPLSSFVTSTTKKYD
jgi:hypothetical protein